MKSLNRRRHHFLNELLSLPGLVQGIQALPPEKFHWMIQQVGLEDCGELVSMATASQLEDLFDIDLWKNDAPGEREKFDANRFMLWLEILLEAGDDVAVEKIVEMDMELLCLALSSQIYVIATETLSGVFENDDDAAHQLDTVLESCLYEELYEYQIIARNPETWDTLLALLVATDKYHHDILCTLLDQLANMGSQELEEDGLYTVLSEIEALGENVQDKREVRRGYKGYVSSLDARSFLGLASLHTIDELLNAEFRDAITHAYFRGYQPRLKQSSSGDPATDISALLSLLHQAHPAEEMNAPVGRLPGQTADNQTLLMMALQSLTENHRETHHQRTAELGYLGNLVMAGCTLQHRRFRAVEASAAVLSTCALGMEVALQRLSRECNMENMQTVIRDISLEKFFLIGWKTLPLHEPTRDIPVRSVDAIKRNVRFFDSVLQLKSR